jgi:hypothetical protein
MMKGRVYSLEESFEWINRNQMNIHAWKPVDITTEFFHSAARRHWLLTSGAAAYFFLGMYPFPKGWNCTHALSDLDIVHPLGFTAASGVAASRLVLSHFQNWLRPSDMADGIVKRLKLGQLPILWEA